MTNRHPLTVPGKFGHQTFLYADACEDLDRLNADIAFLGIPYGSPYSMADVANDQSLAPDAIRQVTDRAARSLERYDFDLDGPIYDDRDVRLVDCGNVPGNMHDFSEHVDRAERAVRKILAAGALPLVAGGDHAVPIPVLRALDQQDPITLIQIDAHIDWRQDVNGETQGLSSTIRRASGRCCMEHEDVGTRPTRDGFQAARSNLGRPSSVIRLRIRTPIMASVF